MVRVKVCGLIQVEQAIYAAEAGSDAIGLVFYDKSPRCVTVEQARSIIASLPPFVTTVGLFLNAAKNEVEQVLDAIALDVLQFHGTEPADYCQAFKRPYIKAIGMKGLNNFEQVADSYEHAQGFLIDSHALGEAGGSGVSFDWSAIPDYHRPIILAGGLTPDNVGEALTYGNVYGVDVSSGVEFAPGMKDCKKVKQFINEVRRVEQS